MSAANLLRAARNHARMSQRQLADRSGVPQSTVARIESGTIRPRIDTLERLLEACGRALQTRVSDPAIPTEQWASIQSNLRLSPEERIRRATEWANLARQLRGAPPQSG